MTADQPAKLPDLVMKGTDEVFNAAPRRCGKAISTAFLQRRTRKAEGGDPARARGLGVELQAGVGMAWVAFVHKAAVPESGPMFTICRWDDQVGLFVRWMNGCAPSVIAFTELRPVLELILDGIFAATQPQLATVPTESWADMQH